MTRKEAVKFLESKGQMHILKYFDELSEEEKTSLLKQIETVDFSVLDTLRERKDAEVKRGVFAPLKCMTIADIEKNREKFESLGEETIRKGETAAVLLAGGQGTRLGFDHPKGMYNVGETRDLYIFQCLINNLKDVTDKVGRTIPLYIMTSEINNRETVRFFEEKNYFGYPKEDVQFFVQDMAPCVSYDGKIMMESKGRIAVSPNGNGGWYHSLKRAGLSEDLKRRNVKYLSCFAVDNVCQRINDPCFVGAFVDSGRDSGGKVVVKADPNERVGVLCTEDGKPSIVEYYEMTNDMITLRDENGNLLYNYGVILNYIFKVDRLDEIVSRGMFTHIVEKKIPCLNEAGEKVKPEAPNGYKFELLVLDMIHMMDDCLPYEVVREREFAPIKNPDGVDSVVTAKELLRKNGVVL